MCVIQRHNSRAFVLFCCCRRRRRGKFLLSFFIFLKVRLPSDFLLLSFFSFFFSFFFYMYVYFFYFVFISLLESEPDLAFALWVSNEKIGAFDFSIQYTWISSFRNLFTFSTCFELELPWRYALKLGYEQQLRWWWCGWWRVSISLQPTMYQRVCS